MDDTPFARTLRMAIAAWGLSHTDLAQLTGIKKQSISAYTRAETTPGRERIAALEQALRLEPGTLARMLTVTEWDGLRASAFLTAPARGVDPEQAEEIDSLIDDAEAGR